MALLYVLSKSYIKSSSIIPSDWVWGKYCRAVCDSPKNAAFKMMVQGSYWVALILHLLGCLWKWLFGVRNILSRVSSTKYNSAEDSAWSGTHWWPNQDALCQIRQRLSFILNLVFYFLWYRGFRQRSFYTQKPKKLWLLIPQTYFPTVNQVSVYILDL